MDGRRTWCRGGRSRSSGGRVWIVDWCGRWRPTGRMSPLTCSAAKLMTLFSAYANEERKHGIYGSVFKRDCKCLTRIGRRRNVRPFVCVRACVCSSHSAILSKWCKLGLQNRQRCCRRNSCVCDKISYRWLMGFLSNKGIKEEYPLRSFCFTAIDSSSIKTVKSFT